MLKPADRLKANVNNVARQSQIRKTLIAVMV